MPEDRQGRISYIFIDYQEDFDIGGSCDLAIQPKQE